MKRGHGSQDLCYALGLVGFRAGLEIGSNGSKSRFANVFELGARSWAHTVVAGDEDHYSFHPFSDLEIRLDFAKNREKDSFCRKLLGRFLSPIVI